MSEKIEYVLHKRIMPDGTILWEKFVPANDGEASTALFGKWPDYQKMKLVDWP